MVAGIMRLGILGLRDHLQMTILLTGTTLSLHYFLEIGGWLLV